MTTAFKLVQCGNEVDLKSSIDALSGPQLATFVNETDEKGYTPLHHACYFDEDSCLTVLLESGVCDLTLLTSRGCSALHTASVSGSPRTLSRLLAIIDADILNAQNEWNETALHLAAGAGNTDAVVALIDACACATLQDRWGRTAMQVACENGAVSVMEAFTSRGFKLPALSADESLPAHVNSNPHQNTAYQAELISEFMARLELPKQSSKGTVVRSIFKQQSPPETTKAGGSALLPTAVSNGSKVLQPHSASEGASTAALNSPSGVLPPFSSPPPLPPAPAKPVAATCLRALSKLVEYPGDPKVLQALLLEPDVDPAGKDMFGVTALMKFAAWDKVDLIDVLLPKLLSSDDSPCEEITTAGAAEIAAATKSAALLNAVSPSEGFTALHHAADMGAGRAYVRLAGMAEVDTSIVDKRGRTAPSVAEANGICT